MLRNKEDETAKHEIATSTQLYLKILLLHCDFRYSVKPEVPGVLPTLSENGNRHVLLLLGLIGLLSD